MGEADKVLLTLNGPTYSYPLEGRDPKEETCYWPVGTETIGLLLRGATMGAGIRQIIHLLNFPLTQYGVLIEAANPKN